MDFSMNEHSQWVSPVSRPRCAFRMIQLSSPESSGPEAAVKPVVCLGGSKTRPCNIAPDSFCPDCKCPLCPAHGEVLHNMEVNENHLPLPLDQYRLLEQHLSFSPTERDIE